MFLLKYQKSIAFFILLFLAGFFLFSSAADASLVPCGKTLGTDAEMQPCTLCHLFIGIHRIIEWGFKILTFVAIAALVAAGIIYIVSAGNEKLIETAKNFAKYTLMGFAIVLGAWLIVNYSMILLSKKSDLGIGITSWSEFECDTESDLGKKSDSGCISLGGTCSTEPNSPSCCEGVCRRLALQGGVPTYTCQDVSCTTTGSHCDEDSECCSGNCDTQSWLCVDSSTTRCEELTPMGMCHESGACPSPLIPYSGFENSCDVGICCRSCGAIGSGCDDNSDCCSGYCNSPAPPQRGTCDLPLYTHCSDLTPPGACEVGACTLSRIPYPGRENSCNYENEVCCREPE